MTETTRVDFRVVAGPSTIAPHAAVVADLHSPFDGRLQPAQVTAQLAQLLPAERVPPLSLPQAEMDFATLAARLAGAVQDWHGSTSLPVRAQALEDGRSRILMGYTDAQATVAALQTGLELAAALFNQSAGRKVDAAALATLMQRARTMMLGRQADPMTRAMMQAARERDIPIYPVSEGSRIWQYGQGCRGIQFFEAATHFDSLTGVKLATDKFLSNQLVRRLGFPGVVHAVADTPDAAGRIARQIGHPLVVKPLDSGKGKGVTMNVADERALAQAFARAAAVSPGRVLVERQVAGKDYRAVVVGGRMTWVVQRVPPQVTGDGAHTVAELIEAENARRKPALAAGFIVALTLDADMQAVLARQGLRPEDRPAAGTAVRLRDIANVALGGMIEDCSAQIHPDNRDLFETIARGFHLDSAGIDFVAPDIAISWRGQPCAVIEVNQTPGFSSDARAQIVLGEKFAPGDDGRIPTVVVVGAAAGLLEAAAAALQARGLRTGRSDAATTLLDRQPRCGQGASLPERVQALLLDPACEALALAVTPEGLEQHGFPLDRCDVALLARGTTVPAPLRALVESCAATVVEDADPAGFDGQARSAIEAAAARRSRATDAGGG